jgi:hypothetical protein
MRLLVLSAALLTVPAGAQFTTTPGSYGPPVQVRAAPGESRDLGDVRDRIEDGRDSGQLSRREARRLRRGADMIGGMSDRFSVGGLSDAEQRELDNRTAVLRDQVNAQRLGVGTPPPRR